MSIKQQFKEGVQADKVLFPKRIERYLLWALGYGGTLLFIVGGMMLVLTESPLTLSSTEAKDLLFVGVSAYGVLLSVIIWSHRAVRYINHNERIGR